MRILLAALIAAAVIPTAGATSANGTIRATGAYHGCASAGTKLYCWGDNSAGELGDGTKTNSLTPVAVRNLPVPVVEVAASYDRTCALVAGPSVYCWGRGATLDAKLKPQASTAPIKVGGLPAGAHGLAVGVTHACVLDVASAVWCWGVNDRGQLGDGTTTSRARPVKAKVAAASQLAASDGYTCAVTAGVYCWGRSHGTAGDPLNPEGLVVNSKTPVAIAGLGAASAVAATGDFACALSGGKVLCWGENDHGQLGDGTLTGRATPAAVAGLPASSQVVATANHACSLSTTGSVSCWGRGDHGQIGNGTFSDSLRPVTVSLPSPAVRLYGSASGHYTIAALADGSTYGWGRDQYGQLGDGATRDEPTPVLVP